MLLMGRKVWIANWNQLDIDCSPYTLHCASSHTHRCEEFNIGPNESLIHNPI